MATKAKKTKSQNRAVALRERVLSGDSAVQVYRIIKDSRFLARQPELRERLAKAFNVAAGLKGE